MTTVVSGFVFDDVGMLKPRDETGRLAGARVRVVAGLKFLQRAVKERGVIVRECRKRGVVDVKLLQ